MVAGMVSLRRTLAVLALALTAALPARAGDGARPIVVELFTSQGCSSCPPADALIGRLARRGDVIAITLPVTYWDMLGWKDTLATDGNTRRQKAYAAAMGHGGVYTPQIIVDGAADVVGSRANMVELAIMQRKAQLQAAAAEDLARIEMARAAAAQAQADAAAGGPGPGPRLAAMPLAPPAHIADPFVPVILSETPQELRIDIGAGPVRARTATVWLIPLRSQVTVKIAAGENQGRAITYSNVATDMRAIGVFKGKPLHLTLPRSALTHDGVAVLVQQDGFGHVIGAAFVSRPDYYAAQ
jgi:hypothetical protein